MKKFNLLFLLPILAGIFLLSFNANAEDQGANTDQYLNLTNGGSDFFIVEDNFCDLNPNDPACYQVEGWVGDGGYVGYGGVYGRGRGDYGHGGYGGHNSRHSGGVHGGRHGRSR